MAEVKEATKGKGGRPAGYSPKAETKGVVIEDNGEFIIVKIPKKQLGKLILKDLL